MIAQCEFSKTMLLTFLKEMENVEGEKGLIKGIMTSRFFFGYNMSSA